MKRIVERPKYGSTFSFKSPGKNPRLSPASTAGLVKMIRLTRPFFSACTAITTAKNVFPVPAGPIPKTKSCFHGCKYSLADCFDSNGFSFGVFRNFFFIHSFEKINCAFSPFVPRTRHLFWTDLDSFPHHIRREVLK